MRGENMAITYIHQCSDWPKSIWDSERFSPLLSGVNLRQGLLLGRTWVRHNRLSLLFLCIHVHKLVFVNVL